MRKTQWLSVMLFLSCAAAWAGPLSIRNEMLEVRVDPAAGRFSMTDLASGKVFVADGRLNGTQGKGSLAKNEQNEKWQSITVLYADGKMDHISLKPGCPFAFFSTDVCNNDDDALTINRFTTLKAPLALGPLDKLSVLGTGGLGRMKDGELKVDSGQPPRKPSTKSSKKTTKKDEPKKEAKTGTGDSPRAGIPLGTVPKSPTGAGDSPRADIPLGTVPKSPTGAGDSPRADIPLGTAPKPPKPLETPKPDFSVPPTPKGDELGSYVWMAVAEPQSRAGVVGAWATQNRASGIVFPRIKDGVLTLEAQLQYGNLLVPPRTDLLQLETFVLGYFADARLGLEQWADEVAEIYDIKLPPQPVGHCTWYMEKNRGASDEKHFLELAQYAAKHLKPFGFDFVQIDDGWQAGAKKNGPKKNFNEIDPRGGYPSGMKATADAVKAAGLAPGIWFMPFAGNQYDPFFADKQDLFVRRQEDGKPYETSWGGTCMDMTNPKTQEYLAQMVHRIAHDWGYTLFKMDGMWTGTGTPQVYVNNGYKEDGLGDAVFHTPSVTNIEAYRAGIKTVRQAAGKDVFLLGCCVSQNMRSLCGAFGLVDAFRIGPDTGSGHIGSPHATRNYFMHGRIWYNDPDCVSVRTDHPLGNARANASFTAISGNLFYNSDWIPDLPPDRLDILKRTMRPHNLKGRPVDLFESPVARLWLLSTPRQNVVALFNWDREKTATIGSTLEHIGLDPKREYAAFDFWENKFLGTIKDRISMDVPADSCAIIALRPQADHPQLLSTSIHVTQGMVDVSGEAWDGKGILSGTSQVVANDPCELRITLPKWWNVASAEAGDLKPEVKSEPGLVRVRFTAKESKAVQWAVKFAHLD